MTVRHNFRKGDKIPDEIGVDEGAGGTGPGTSTARTVGYPNLEPNRSYRAELSVANQSGRTTTQVMTFDTWSTADAVVIEVEDYNYGGGNFVSPAPPGSYAGRTGTPGIDYAYNVAVTNLAAALSHQ